MIKSRKNWFVIYFIYYINKFAKNTDTDHKMPLVICDVCHKPFDAPYHWYKTCNPKCTKILNYRRALGDHACTTRNAPCDNLPEPDMMNPDYDVRLVIEATTAKHDGYCSGAEEDDVRHNTFTKTIVTRLFTDIEQDDIDPVTGEITNLPLLNKLYRPVNFGCGCKYGEFSFTIESATVFKKSALITLIK